MSGQTMWAVAIVLVVAAAVIGFLLGRVSAGGAHQRNRELEDELKTQKRAVDAYKREVDAHFDQTASLFVSMAGSYKELFEHLSSGYAKLSGGEDKDLFRQHVATMLLDGPRQDESVLESEHADETASRARAAEQADEAAPESADSEQTDVSSTDEADVQASVSEETPAQRLDPAEQKEREIRGVAPPHSAPTEEAAAVSAVTREAAPAEKMDEARKA